MESRSSEKRSNGYQYGEYRFTLEHQEVLDLFMGENLYDDPFVFIRELLQNAIDATRHRVHFEKCRGNADFTAETITVSHWRDEDGYQWVRVDDGGMGMNEDLVKTFLLKVGRSYYTSAQFRADQLRYETQLAKPFVPISQFGIGILSCFIGGDRVEISTRHIEDDEHTVVPVRLSLSGLHGFYTLTLPPNPIPKMPSAAGAESGERQSPGTTVAVRIAAARDIGTVDVPNLLERYVFCSEIPVEFEGPSVGGERTNIVGRPRQNHVKYPLAGGDLKELEQLLGFKFSEPVEVHILPLDLAKHRPTEALQGQALAGRVVGKQLNEALAPSEGSDHKQLGFRIDHEGYLRLDVKSEKEMSDRRRQMQERTLRLDALNDQIAPDVRELLKGLGSTSGAWVGRRNWFYWSHNGIRLPTQFCDNTKRICWLGWHDAYGQIEWIVGTISLTDALRPQVSAARDLLRRVTWNVNSAITLALFRAIREYPEAIIPHRLFSCFWTYLGREEPSLDDIRKDPLITDPAGWPSEPVFHTANGMMSVREIQEAVREGTSITIEHGVLSVWMHQSQILVILRAWCLRACCSSI